MRLADDLACALDPVTFARALGFDKLDAWQQGALRWDGRRALWNCARQTGKSTVAAILATHKAIYHAGSLTLLVSPSLRQSSELFRKVGDFLDRLETPAELTEDNKLSLTMVNKARVVSLPSSEATIRGFSAVDLLIEDEASRVSDDIYRALRPSLAVSEGRLLLMSTPFGKRGHFFEEWGQGGAIWERVEVRAEQCPRISAAFLAEERAALGDLWYGQEYECRFSDNASSVFSYDLVMGAVSPDVAPLFAPVATAPSSGVRQLFVR